MSHPGEHMRGLLMAVVIALSLGIGVLCVVYELGWRGATFATFVPLAVIQIHVLVTRDRLLGALLLFGLVAGLCELPTDAYDVLASKTLVYPADQPLLWTSPFYMPLTWCVAVTVLGSAAWWLTRRLGLLKATVALAALGAVVMPGFEIMARHAGFWFYRGSPMLLDAAPFYVILAEGAICGSLPLMTLGIEGRRWPMIVLLGVIEASWIFVTTWIFTELTV